MCIIISHLFYKCRKERRIKTMSETPEGPPRAADPGDASLIASGNGVGLGRPTKEQIDHAKNEFNLSVDASAAPKGQKDAWKFVYGNIAGKDGLDDTAKRQVISALRGVYVDREQAEE